jgi:chromosome segregation ATPase
MLFESEDLIELRFLLQSLLLSKALKLQQENEEIKNEFIISGLEEKIKNLENSLKEKDSLLSIAEGSLTEARL